MTVPTIPHSSPRHSSSTTSKTPPRPSYHRRSSTSHSMFQLLEEDSRDMAEHGREPESKQDTLSPAVSHERPVSISGDSFSSQGIGSTPGTPGNLSRSGSFSDIEDAPDRLTMFDLIENLDLPRRLEKLQRSMARRASRSQERFKSSSRSAREKVVEEWRRRVPTSDGQLDRYEKRMGKSVDRLSRLWKDSRSVTLWEKASFIAGVVNIFICGYLIGAHPQWFHCWYTVQLAYFMPIRYFTYTRKGYHYFLADFCYFVNVLTLLSIYVFPRSKRLLISTFCLAFGNNAIAIAMWRNSLVFHSMDKVVSLFIHIMPCVTLHCLIHLIPKELQKQRYPAIHTILYSVKPEPEHYTLPQMMFWASLPYALWQGSYHFLISVRRRDKILAGRPTSFTWLRRSYSNAWIGKIVLSLPEMLQEPMYMFIQYVYALCTMVPCPLWFWSRWASGIFLTTVFTWSVWNGATYYIDVFGTRFQKELEALKKDVAKWQSEHALSDGGMASPPFSPSELNTVTPGLDAAAQTGSKLTKDEQPPALSALVEDTHPDAVNGLPGLDGGMRSGDNLVGDEPEGKKDI